MTMKGFTLIETMVAVAILAIAIAGPMYTANRAIVAAELSQDQLTASYLAQEGIEYVRAMRDDEYLAAYQGQTSGENVSTVAWNNFLNGSDAASITGCRTSTCMLDPMQPMGTGSVGNDSIIPCGGSTGVSCTPLYLANNGTTNYYTEQSGSGATATPFTRTVQVLDVSGTNNDKRVVSTVSWSFHSIPYSVTITDQLTPWQ